MCCWTDPGAAELCDNIPAPHTASSSWWAHSSDKYSSEVCSECSYHTGQTWWPKMSGHTSLRLVEAGPVHMKKGKKTTTCIHNNQKPDTHWQTTLFWVHVWGRQYISLLLKSAEINVYRLHQGLKENLLLLPLKVYFYWTLMKQHILWREIIKVDCFI